MAWWNFFRKPRTDDMTAHTLAQTQKGYGNLFAKAKLTSPNSAHAAAQRIIAARDKLEPVEAATGVPWWLVGCWLYRESNLDFATFLGNGQSLKKATTMVPAHMGPFDNFLDGAVAAIMHEEVSAPNRKGMFYKSKVPWDIAHCLWASEEFNGEGYFSHAINSPYVWSWTDLYTSGKFDADGHYNSSLHDPQGGVAAIMMALFEIDASLRPSEIAKPEPAPQPEPEIAPAPQEAPVTETTTTTTTTATQAPSAKITLPGHGIDFAQIESYIEMGAKFLPIAAGFFPPLRAVEPFIPILEGALKLADELEKSDGQPQTIATIVAAHLHTVAANIEQGWRLPNLNLPNIQDAANNSALGNLLKTYGNAEATVTATTTGAPPPPQGSGG